MQFDITLVQADKLGSSDYAKTVSFVDRAFEKCFCVSAGKKDRNTVITGNKKVSATSFFAAIFTDIAVHIKGISMVSACSFKKTGQCIVADA